MSELAVLDRTGDTRIQWDKLNNDETEEARQRFNEFRAKGFASFKVDSSGLKGEQIDEFDASAERIILVPQMVGG